MTRSVLYESLYNVNHSRQKRMEMANLVLANSSLVTHLLDIAFAIDDPISCRACWVLEFTSKEKIDFILPHLDTFTTNMGRVHQQSAVRPVAKVCERLIEAYFSKIKNKTQEKLTPIHLEAITTACFDWLIGDHKVAAKAYAMRCLQLLGYKYKWIHPELKLVLEKDFASGSAAYKARASLKKHL